MVMIPPRVISCLFIVLTMFPGSGRTADGTLPPQDVISPPFSAGEAISYKIHFGAITGGIARRSVVALVEINGRQAYQLVSESRSNKTFDAFHKVREHNESWMDAETFSSLRFLENVRNGSYRKTSDTKIDPMSRRMTHSYKTTKHSGDTEITAPEGTQDIISVVYFLRTRILQVGNTYDIPLQSGGKIKDLKVRVTGVDEAKVPAGKFECLHIEPELEAGDDPQKDIDLELWVTNDEQKIPVLIKSKLSFGSFVAEMTEYSAGSARMERNSEDAQTGTAQETTSKN